MGYFDRWRSMIPKGHWAEGDPALDAFYTALASQCDDLVAAIHAAVTYLSPADADADGLTRWEQLLAIGSDGDLATRRMRIQHRLAGYGTIRTEVLAAIAQAYGAQVQIEEIPAQYKFVVHFQSPMGVPSYDAELRSAYDQAKRATWDYEFVYIYNVWADTKTKTWAQIKAAGLTWGQLKTTDLTTI